MFSWFLGGAKEGKGDAAGKDSRIDLGSPLSSDLSPGASSPTTGARPTRSRLTDLYTWGGGQLGRLGHGTESSQPAPQLVHSLIGKRLIQVGCGAGYSVAVTEDGSVYVWGRLADHSNASDPAGAGGGGLGSIGLQNNNNNNNNNSSGGGNNNAGSSGHISNGNGNNPASPSPPRALMVPRLLVALQSKDVRQVACGPHHVVFLTHSGEVHAMGRGVQGGGDRVTTPCLITALQGKGVRQVACGDGFSMALTDNDDVYTWGKGDEGQLGHGGWQSEPQPRLVQSLRGKAVASIAAGARHAACVTESGELYTWGCGKNGRLGHGGGADFAVGMVVKGLLDERVSAVALGVAHTVALTETGRIFTWGANHFGQLGHGHTLELDRPVPLPPLGATDDDPEARAAGCDPAADPVVSVRCGAYHTGCMTAGGAVFTWGCGNKGVLGHGDCQRQTRPAEVMGLRGKACSDLALGPEHCAAITAHVWIPDEESDACLQCEVPFSLFTRRSHCRHCGRIFCRSCASRYVAIPRFGFHNPVRVCDVCHSMLTGTTT